MADIQVVRKILAEEYGIKSDWELAEALKKMPPINIGVFASPVAKPPHNRKDSAPKSSFFLCLFCVLFLPQDTEKCRAL